MAVKGMAMLFSILFHPLFIPVIAMAYLAFVQGGYFLGVPDKEKIRILLSTGVNTIVFPAITILLLKGLGFIKSIFLRTQRERVIPYVASNIFYFWLFLVFKNQPQVPQIAAAFMLGVFLSSTAALVLNSFFKISMHALGMGAFCGLLLVIVFSGFPNTSMLPLMVVFLLTGIVLTSRLILSNHTFFDLNSGLIISIICQIIGFAIMMI